MNHIRRIAVTAAIGCATVAMTGCTASQGEKAPEPAPAVTITVTETAPPAAEDAERGLTDIVTAKSALGECSQASALAGTMYRAAWQRDEGIIYNDAYYAIADAVGDSWTKVIVAQSDVSEAMQAAKDAAQNGILGNGEFDDAYDELESACTGAGYRIAMTALEGQPVESG